MSEYSLMISPYDFGYSWPWTHGHLVLGALLAAFALAARRYKWKWLSWVCLVGVLWSLAGFVIVQEVFRLNKPVVLPGSQFLSSGKGRVLDAGAGGGRSALMVLLARPEARVVALDDFSADYIASEEGGRLLANARLAGVEGRVEVVKGDMREMPLESDSFDAVVGAYSIDHLNAEGAGRALKEVHRVLKPGGQLLFLTIHRDMWVRVAYPFLHGHLYYGRSSAEQRWRSRFEEAGLEVVERGTQPGTLYILCRKR